MTKAIAPRTRWRAKPTQPRASPSRAAFQPKRAPTAKGAARITAKGSTFSNPAANYYRIARDSQNLAETTAQLFFGIRMQCAKCHNHPFERWTQDDYYSMAAWFARVKQKADRSEPATAPGQLGAEVIYNTRGGEVTQPRTGRVIAPKYLGGAVPKIEARQDRREVLADWLAAADNPFFAVGAKMGGEVGANIQKVFSYGHRNGFGMAFDPYGTDLWVTENGDDTFSEINRVEAGSNGGWIQIMGPQHRFFDFKEIEVTMFNGALQQVRFPPTRLRRSKGRRHRMRCPAWSRSRVTRRPAFSGLARSRAAASSPPAVRSEPRWSCSKRMIACACAVSSRPSRTATMATTGAPRSASFLARALRMRRCYRATDSTQRGSASA